MEDSSSLINPDIVPINQRDLRACYVCSLVKSADSFMDFGCENCPFLHMEGDQDRIYDCTSPKFDGLIAMMNPSKSWVATWQRLHDGWHPGCYAISVSGSLPDRIAENLKERNIGYRSKETAITKNI